ncbi:unnamed protein product [Adineta ricciae]|uniref:Acid ceramidase n=1 Tax=Adineta ricciae TaxID=249248 RepID=A0A816FZ36_ADIRI|nr:unnamed protein product [Adineta ricciae]
MMHTVYATVGLLLVVKSSFAQQCLTNQRPSASDMNIPSYVVDLDTPPFLRWKEIAIQYKSEIRDLLNYTKSYVINVWPMSTFLLDIMHTQLPLIANTLPEPYSDELKGISQASGISLGEIVFYNVFYEVSLLCTSIIAQDQQGRIIHGRNLDFGYLLGWDRTKNTWALLSKLRPLVISVNYTKHGQVHYRSISFAGFIGALTGVKPGVFSVSLNARFDLNGGYIGIIEWLYNFDRQQSFVTFALRDMLTNAKNYSEVLNYLSDVLLVAPCYYILAGTKPGEGAIISRSRRTTLNIKRLGVDNNWFLIQTNSDNWRQQSTFDDRYISAKKCMKTQGQSRVDFDSIYNVLVSRPMLNKLTIYTSLMKPSTGQLESFLQYCRDEDITCTLW